MKYLSILRLLLIYFIFTLQSNAQTIVSTNKKTNASTPKNSSAVFDGNTSTMWGEGGYAPAWVSVDLGKIYNITEINFIPEQSPSGNTKHEVYFSNDGNSWNLIETVSLYTRAGEAFIRNYDNQARYVKIKTIKSPSWVAWRDIQVKATASIVANENTRSEINHNSYSNSNTSQKTYNNATDKECISGNCKNGYGTWMFLDSKDENDAVKYVGYFKNNVIEGEGTMYFRNGATITGSFVQNKANGQCTILYADGSKYVGNVENFKKMGKGVSYFTDGDVWSGIWDNSTFVSGTKNGVAYSNPNYTNRITYNGNNDFGAMMADQLPKGITAGAIIYKLLGGGSNDEEREPSRLEKLFSSCVYKESISIFEYDRNIYKNAYYISCRNNSSQNRPKRIVKISKDGSTNFFDSKNNSYYDETDTVEYLAKQMCGCQVN